MIENAVIVANGDLNGNARLRELWQGADIRIAADGGAKNARLHLERPPDVLVGDFDSLDAETAAWLEQYSVEKYRYPPEKDNTDLELAVDFAQRRGAERVTIIGALGGRVDQMLANILLLTRTPDARITDGESEIWCATGHAVVEGARGDVVSLIPLDERAEGIVTKDLQYPLRNEALARGSTRGISNVMLAARAEVDWAKGLMLIVHLFF